jgi:hypothetical protein
VDSSRSGYHVEAWDLRVPKHMLGGIAGSIDWETAVKDLIAARYWADAGDAYVIRHHANVILQSLSAQAAKRERDRLAQKRARDRAAARAAAVSADVSDDASAYLTDRQAEQHQRGRLVSRSAPDWLLVRQIVRIVCTAPAAACAARSSPRSCACLRTARRSGKRSASLTGGGRSADRFEGSRPVIDPKSCSCSRSSRLPRPDVRCISGEGLASA